jgi:hypothetical protein
VQLREHNGRLSIAESKPAIQVDLDTHAEYALINFELARFVTE